MHVVQKKLWRMLGMLEAGCQRVCFVRAVVFFLVLAYILCSESISIAARWNIPASRDCTS